MPPAHAVRGRRNVQNEEEVLDAVYATPWTSTVRVAYETHSLRLQSGVHNTSLY
jgi:hypothetical protein